jgi:peptide/nickel transport system substrate-binding protein
MTGKIQKLFALLLVVSLAIVGCSDLRADNNQLAIGVLGDPNTFNPALNNVATSYFDYTTEGLVTVNGKGELEPALAESWKINGNSILFKLRPNLKWSDGAPLTTDDVDFSFNEVYLNKNIPTDGQDGLKIGKDKKFPTVKKIDDLQIEIISPEPFAPALRTLGGVGILPAHKLRTLVRQNEETKKTCPVPKGSKEPPKVVIKKKSKFLTAWGISTKPSDLVSSGPYRLISYVPAERMVFERNPYYWRKDSEGQQQPYIKKVVWQIVESTDNSLMQFRSGNLDTYGVTPEFFSLLKKEEKQGNFTIRNLGPASGTTFLSFNLNEGQRDGKPLVEPKKARWFNNVKFRQAVAYAIDRERMINNLYRGLGANQNSPISIGTPFYLAKGLKEYNYDLAKSKQLLQEAGFKYKGNELYDDRGNRVRFNLITNTGNKVREAVGTQVKQDLAKIGMEVDFNPVAFSLLVDKLDKSLDWDAHIIGFTGGIEPHDGTNFWAVDGRSHVFNQRPATNDDAEADPDCDPPSSAAQPPTVGNKPLPGQKVAPWEQAISDLYVKGSQELDPVKRKEIYYETQRLTQENLPCIYLVNSLSMTAARNNLKNFKPSTITGSLWNLYEVKIEK